MTLAELESRLAASNVPRDCYCLTGGLPNEASCIDKSDGKWQVYYSERGGRSGLKDFDNEHDACNYFFDSLMKITGASRERRSGRPHGHQ
jgi:hypothetical protein